MNVLLISLGTEFYETEQQVLLLARGLCQRNQCRVALICADGSPLQHQALKAGVEVFSLSTGLVGRSFGKLRLRWFFRRNTGRWIVHAHDNLSGQFGLKLAQKHQNLLLMHSRHLPLPLRDNKLEEGFRNARIVACETQEVAYAMAESKVPPRALKIVHGGIDAAEYPSREPRNDGRIVLSCECRLERGRGLETLLRALPALLEAPGLPPWEMRFTGAGPAFQPLLDLATELGVESRLAFLGGQDPKAVLPHCDILIAPTEHGEGCSQQILEAWAIGLPVLCSDSLSHQEMARDQQDSLFFTSGAPADLAEKLISLCHNRELGEYLVEGGRQSIKDYHYEIMVDNYLELYHRLLD